MSDQTERSKFINWRTEQGDSDQLSASLWDKGSDLADGWQFRAALDRGTVWRPIDTRPKKEMFIWARSKGDGTYGVGLGYNNVSGGWSDAYGADITGVTLWAPMPGVSSIDFRTPPPDDARRQRELRLLRYAHELDMTMEASGEGYPMAETVLKRFDKEQAEEKQA